MLRRNDDRAAGPTYRISTGVETGMNLGVIGNILRAEPERVALAIGLLLQQAEDLAGGAGAHRAAQQDRRASAHVIFFRMVFSDCFGKAPGFVRGLSTWPTETPKRRSDASFSRPSSKRASASALRQGSCSSETPRPEMVAAGVAVLWASGAVEAELRLHELLVSEIYRAMRLASGH